MSSLISAKNLCLSYSSASKETQVLTDLTYEMDQGELVSVVGPSGSGKTSLMMILSGLEKPSSGELSVAGNNFSKMSEDELAIFRRTNVGVIFQNFHLVPTMTALENVSLPLEFAGVSNAKTLAAELLDKVGLSNRLGNYPGQLSGGEQQRVGIARALVAKPAILFADEPTGNLDQETGKKISSLLFELCRANNTAMMLITHDPVMADLTDRKVRLRDGQLEA